MKKLLLFLPLLAFFSLSCDDQKEHLVNGGIDSQQLPTVESMAVEILPSADENPIGGARLHGRIESPSPIKDCGFYFSSRPELNASNAENKTYGDKVILEKVPVALKNVVQNTATGATSGDFYLEIDTLKKETKFYFIPYAVNNAGMGCGEKTEFYVPLTPEPPAMKTDVATAIDYDRATLNGSLISNNRSELTAAGFYISMSELPTDSDGNISVEQSVAINSDGSMPEGLTAESIVKVPYTTVNESEQLVFPMSVSITGLTPDTPYYYTAFGVNEKGEGTGEQITFTTLEYIILATVENIEPSEVTDRDAVLGGKITNDGGGVISEKGIVWSTDPNLDPSTETTNRRAISGDLSPEGIFSEKLSLFTWEQTYYVWAYATNEKGTVYASSPVSFTTLERVPQAPAVDNGSATIIKATRARISASIPDDGGSEVTAYGLKYGTSPDALNQEVNFTGKTEAFTVDLEGLSATTPYYYKVYATNANGTGESETAATFTTADFVVHNGIQYDELFPIGTKTFLDRNLGATKCAENLADIDAFGWLFQWGRPADGHQIVDWHQVITSLNYNDATGLYEVTYAAAQPGMTNDGKTISAAKYPDRNDSYPRRPDPTTLGNTIFGPGNTGDDGYGTNDWATSANTTVNGFSSLDVWTGTPSSNNNNPCPPGYVVPTVSDLKVVVDALTGGTDHKENLNQLQKIFKITLSGLRNGNDGMITGVGGGPDGTSLTRIWTRDSQSTAVNNTAANSMNFKVSLTSEISVHVNTPAGVADAGANNLNRRGGAAVRCLKAD